MGREVRRVPKDWEHPRNKQGYYIPLYDNFAERVAAWDEGKAKWDDGMISDFEGGWREKPEYVSSETYEEWAGERPEEKDYMPDWPDEQRTHLQMYEDTTEGTPISPVMETPEELARWLVDNGASAFGGMTATYEQWLATCKAGWAPSALFSEQTGLISGVAGMTQAGL